MPFPPVSSLENTPFADPLPRSKSSRIAGVVAITLAIVILVGGLLFFAHTQTQALFKDARDLHLLNIQSPRNDGAILLGALLMASGITTLLARLSPLRPSDRWVPATVLAVTTTILLVAHFSIFINGLTFPDQRVLAVQSAFLFHDSTATIPIATFTLAVVTLLLIAISCLSIIALIAPHALKDQFLRPRTLTAHRARLFIVSLLLLAIASTFARQFFSFAITAETKPLGDFFATNLLAMIYYLMGIILAVLLVLITWRTGLLLWGRMDDRRSRRFKISHQRMLTLETTLWGLLLSFTIITLFGDPIYLPPSGSDPVFAISSQGVSWAFFLVFAIYYLQRKVTKAQYEQLYKLPRPLPRIKVDHLMIFGILAAALWTLGGLFVLTTNLSPVGQLVVRLIPIILLIPFFALRVSTTDISTPKWASASSPILIFTWGILSILTGIMLWGIGNSVTVIFSQGSGGFLTPEDQFLQPFATGIRLLGSLFLAAPLVLVLWLFTGHQRRMPSPALLVITGISVVFTMNILLTIDPGARFDPVLGHTDVLIGFWAFLMPTDFDVVFMAILAGLSAAVGTVAALIILHNGIDKNAPRLPWSGWWPGLRNRIAKRFNSSQTPEQRAAKASKDTTTD